MVTGCFTALIRKIPGIINCKVRIGKLSYIHAGEMGHERHSAGSVRMRVLMTGGGEYDESEDRRFNWWR